MGNIEAELDSIFIDDGIINASYVKSLGLPVDAVREFVRRLAASDEHILEHLQSLDMPVPAVWVFLRRLGKRPGVGQQIEKEVFDSLLRGLCGGVKSTAKQRGRVKWKVAQSLMLTRLKNETLPKSLRDAQKAIDYTYSTTRKAVTESDALKTHFGLSGAKAKPAAGKLLEELTSQADAHTKRYLEHLQQSEREEMEKQLNGMPADKRLELLKTLATSPDGGSCGDVSYRDELDSDSDEYSDDD